MTETNDKKYDQGKPMVGQMKKDFAKALMVVAWITTYGTKKYNQPGSWRHVENGEARYNDADGRHDLMRFIEPYDQESGFIHEAHDAWNALAILEKKLEDHIPHEALIFVESNMFSPEAMKVVDDFMNELFKPKEVDKAKTEVSLTLEEMVEAERKGLTLDEARMSKTLEELHHG